MPSGSSNSRRSFDSTLYVLGIDIRLGADSRKTVESVKLSKNGKPLRDIQTTIRASEVHREEFIPPLSLDPDDHICVLVNCSLQWRDRSVSIDIDPRDIECTPDEKGLISYRKNTNNIDIVVTGHQQSLSGIKTQIIQACSQFRLLIIGNSGVGKSSLIRTALSVKDVHTSDTTRGIADIDREFISQTDNGFIVHDSLGFEAADEDNVEIVRRFVSRRMNMPLPKDQLHAIWLCLETPYAGGRLLESGVARFLQRRNEILGDIPLIVVLTKIDLLDLQLEIDLQANEDFKSEYLDHYCIRPLFEAAGSDITYVVVSAEDGYSDTLFTLLTATKDSLAKYRVRVPGPTIHRSIHQHQGEY